MDNSENAEERVTKGDSARKGRIDLTQGEGRIHSSILVRDYETLIEAIDCLGCHFGTLSNTVGHDGEYLKPRENNHYLMRARDLLIGLRRTLQEREQDAHARSKGGRIDLTQFDGHTPAPWESFANFLNEEMGVGDANTLLIANTPELLAELKKCYEEIDELLETIGGWGYVMCPRSNEWFEWDYGCQSETCSSHDDDCRELVEASE